MSACPHCETTRHPVSEFIQGVGFQKKCVECNMFITDDSEQRTIVAHPPPPPGVPRVPVVRDGLDIVELTKQRLAELDQKLAQYDSLRAERDKLARMLGAIGE